MDTTVLDSSSNSFKSYYDRKKTPIHYSYKIKTRTHDYSRNWDFDGDGETDKLYFIGAGGVHEHFYLRIILSSDKKIRNFPFLSIDFPMLGDMNQLQKSSFYPPPVLPQFVVDNFSKPGHYANDKIYLHLDEHWTQIPPEWKKGGVSSTYLLLYYEKRDVKIKNFIN